MALFCCDLSRVGAKTTTMHPGDDGTMAELVAMTVRLELVSHHLYDE